MATSLRLTADGNFDALMRNRLPAADYAAWRQDWEAARAGPQSVSPARAQQFAEIMRMLTAPNAEAALLKRLQPQLARLQRSTGGAAPIFSGILEAAGKEMIAASPQLGPTQKAMAAQGLGALVAWATTADFSDAKKAKHAIALVCGTARSLHVQTLEQWQALDYATAMQDYGLIWNTLEQLASMYGLNLAQSLTDAKITTTGGGANAATVRVDLSLAGKPVAGAWTMRRIDDHWYDASLLDAWRNAHPANAGTPATPASGASAPTAATPAAAASAPGPATVGPGHH